MNSSGPSRACASPTPARASAKPSDRAMTAAGAAPSGTAAAATTRAVSVRVLPPSRCTASSATLKPQGALDGPTVGEAGLHLGDAAPGRRCRRRAGVAGRRPRVGRRGELDGVQAEVAALTTASACTRARTSTGPLGITEPAAGWASRMAGGAGVDGWAATLEGVDPEGRPAVPRVCGRGTGMTQGVARWGTPALKTDQGRPAERRGPSAPLPREVRNLPEGCALIAAGRQRHARYAPGTVAAACGGCTYGAAGVQL